MAGAALAAMTPGLAQAQTAAAPAQEENDVIVVTGSLLANDPANAPQPIQTVTAESLEARGVTSVVDAIERLPALLVSNNVEQSLRDSAVTGRATLNLRGLGAARTLVLVNGRRHVAGAPGTASVDTSSIPTGLIDRVEVLTGGASAVYGSDAVTGVVNFILKDDFEGIRFDQQLGLSEQGDAGEVYASVLAGTNFGPSDRGNVVLNVSYNHRSGINDGDRDFSGSNGVADDYTNPDLLFQTTDPLPPGVTAAQAHRQTILLASGAPRFANTPAALLERARNATPRAIRRDPRFSISSTAGIIGIDSFGIGFANLPGDFTSLPDVNNNGINDCNESTTGRRGFGCHIIDPVTGQLRPFRDGVFAGSSNQFGGDGSAQRFPDQSLTPTTTSFALNLIGDYEVNKHFNPYVELKAVENRARENAPYKTFDDFIRIAADNPFIPASVQNLINAEIAADPSLADTIGVTIMRDNIDIFDPKDSNKRTTYRGVIGTRGDLAWGFDYDVSANYGKVKQTTRSANRLIDRYFASIDAVRDPGTGNIVCRSSLDPLAEPPISDFPGAPFPGFVTFDPTDGSCAPLNLFGTGAPSAAAREFNSFYETSTATIEQTVYSALVRGDTASFFSLPGGPIGIAVGAEYREEKSEFIPDEYRQLGYYFDGSVTNQETGKFDVKEAFAEVSLPLLADLPFVHNLTVNAAFRAGDYSTVGNTESWKVDGIFAPIPDIRFRAGIAETVRAPNITELFGPEQGATFRPIDPCDAANITRGPNPTNRAANCLADGIPVGFADPLTARFVGVTSGNRNLKAETSESLTVGVVLQPRFLEGFTATIDYWDISIEDAIAAVTAQEIVDACYDAPSLGNSFCGLFTRNRNPASLTFLGFNFLRQSSVNFASLEAAGVDFDFSYLLDFDTVGIPADGGFTFRVAGTYLDKNLRFESATRPDAANPEKFELDYPELALTSTFGVAWGKLQANLYSTYIGRQLLRGVEYESRADFTPAYAPVSWSHDASLQWEATDKIAVTLGVTNLTDEEPFITETSIPVSGVGRAFYVRVGATF